jgi:hypothetical protein
VGEVLEIKARQMVAEMAGDDGRELWAMRLGRDVRASIAASPAP